MFNTRSLLNRAITLLVLLAFLGTGTGAPLPYAAAQEVAGLPAAGTRISLSPVFAPPLLKGIKVYPNDPFRFDFILETGDSPEAKDIKTDSNRLIKYFLAALTVPEKDIWVNLSPYEGDRIVADGFGQTEMGRDLLAQDYILKQITASVIYPEEKIGKEFWDKVYAEALKRYGTTDVPIDTFNKVWIVPEKATVYETKDSAFVVESRLKVMLDEDYLALQNNRPAVSTGDEPATNKLGSEIVREVVIPILEKEVNEGKNFAPLRQVYHSLILATWYKRKVKDSLLGQAYVAKDKTAGIDIADKNEKEKIWQQYVVAFKAGAYNLIKEEYDPGTQTTIPRKYFSGGFLANDAAMNVALAFTNVLPKDAAMKGNALVIDALLAPMDAAMTTLPQWNAETIRPEVIRLVGTPTVPKRLRYTRLTTEQLPALTDWLLSKDLLPSPALTHQLMYNIYLQSTSGDKKIADGWLSLMAQKWNLNKDILPRLMLWFKQNRVLDTVVSEANLYAFMQAVIANYQKYPDLRRTFVYNLAPNLSADMQLDLTTQNLSRMTNISTEDFIANRAVLKAPIQGTPYFIGFQYGLAESTHGLYLALGKEKNGHDPLDGTFFRIGLDAQGDALRVIMMQGLADSEKEINETFPNTVGLHPGIALLYVAAALAEQGHLRYTEQGLTVDPKKPFQRLSGIRPEFIPTMKNGTPSIGTVAKATLVKASPGHGDAIFEQLKHDGYLKGDDLQGYIRVNLEEIRPWLQKYYPDDIAAVLPVFRQRDNVQLMINYTRFGLRKSTAFDRWAETSHITDVLIPGRLKAGDIKSNAITALTNAFHRLKPVVVKALNAEDELQRGLLTDDLSTGAPAAPDEAMLTPGGIDLQPDKINLKTQNNGEAITLAFDPVQLARIQRSAGLRPVIVNVFPLENLSQFLGVEK